MDTKMSFAKAAARAVEWRLIAIGIDCIIALAVGFFTGHVALPVGMFAASHFFKIAANATWLRLRC